MGTKKTTKNVKKVSTSVTPKSSRLWSRHKKLWVGLLIVFGGLSAIILSIYIAFLVSPWPGAMFIRHEFDKGGTKTATALEKHVPPGITKVANQQYANDKDTFLDVFYPEGTKTALPTVVWVHGGAWVSGNKSDTDNYLKILAARGYTTVSINYSIAPEHKYPTPILQLNDALDYLQRNATRLNIDDSRIVLGGDSAGSQIVAQMATIITSSTYAKDMAVTPTLAVGKLKGMLLNCGAYDLNLPRYDGADGWFLRTVLWAYSGSKDFLHDPELKHASVVNYITKDFPPSFITAGNADPLEAQSKELANRLSRLGVPTSTLFYPEDHQPRLMHEYQFDLDIDDGKKALEQMTAFLKEYLH